MPNTEAIKVGEEVSIRTEKGSLLPCRVERRFETNGVWVLELREPQTGTIFRRPEKVFLKPDKSIKFAPTERPQ